jgi:hypothetical protein
MSNKFAFFGKWRLRQNCKETHFSQHNQGSERDTNAVCGLNRNNGLVIHSGHSTCALTKENPGATAIATGVKDVVEGVYFPDQNSPEWAGAPAIILRHFCGVAA